MFVLPPLAWSHGAGFKLTFSLPPRYPNGNLYTGMPGGGLLETNNTLEHPTGPDYQLVVGEGTYLLRDDLHLATPPPHPSDAPQPNNNPLATTIGPPTAGTKLSLAVIAPRRSPARNLYRPTTAQSGRSGMPPSIQEESAKSDSGSTANGYGSASNRSIHSSAFGDGNPALQAAPVKGKKGDQRVKPKNNIVKSNSSFVSRVIPHESLQKRLNERSPEGMLAFANVNRALMWLDLSSENQKTENMTKVLFTKAHALCHDIHEYTKSQTHMDVVIGFNSGDIIWYECMSQKYARLNKNGIINATAVSQILWVPNKENFFLAAHMDGSIIAYDKDKEDADFVSEEDMTNGHVDGAVKLGIKFSIRKSIQSRNQKSNPIAWWKVSNMKVNNMAFSPDGLLLAIVCDDGTLTIMDYIHERVLDVFRSYYGAILCVTWSPDGRYVLTG
ncbi:catabolite repression protein creC, partial [Hortaea werneckii]